MLDVLQRGDDAIKELPGTMDFLIGDEDARFRIARDASLAPQMLLKLGAAQGGINRHRNRTGEQCEALWPMPPDPQRLGSE